MTTMTQWQARVIVELVELEGKLSKLKMMLSSEQFAGMEGLDRLLLSEQHFIMVEYSRVLNERIKRF